MKCMISNSVKPDTPRRLRGSRRIHSAFIVAAALVSLLPVGAESAIPTSQRNALIAIYNNTDGPLWTDNDGWLGSPGTECWWHGVTCNASSTSVIEIDLTYNRLDGALPPEIGDLADLEVLILRSNSLGGELPIELFDLINLRVLSLHGNTLRTTFPAAIGNLTQLVELDLGSCYFDGSLPPEIGNLGQLEFLDISDSFVLSGPIPSEIGNLSNLRTLDLGTNNLQGWIPPEIANLENLTHLSLRRNALTGPIPPGLGDLANLESLSLSFNRLSGEIPDSLGTWPQLTYLSLAYNDLTGTIPPALANHPEIQILDLANNRLGGEIPFILGLMPNVGSIDLTDNKFRGEIPASLVAFCDNGGSLAMDRNALYTSDPSLAATLTACGAEWETQGTSPHDPVILHVGSRTITLGWTPIEWTDDGSYEVLVSTTPGGPYRRIATTALLDDKSADLMTAGPLQPATTYHAVLRSVTYPGGWNPNTVVSDPGPELVFTTLPADTFHVAVTGDDQNQCLVPLFPCRTIQAAVDRAQSGDAVKIATGTYEENIVVNKDLVLQGSTGTSPVIDGRETAPAVFVGNGSTVTLQNLHITNGLASYGGGVFNSGGTLFVLDSEVHGNRALFEGGAFFNQGGLLVVENSTIAENLAGSDAVIGTPATEIQPGITGFRNSTLSGNTSTNAYSRVISPSTLMSCTITDNRAGVHGFILEGGTQWPYNEPVSSVHNTIIADNRSPNCRAPTGIFHHPNISDGDECFYPYEENRVIFAALLEPLGSNGGPTRTHALAPGSPAIDSGDDDGAPAADQRGIPRPMDGNGDGVARTDLGAFELGDMPEPVFSDGFERGDATAWSVVVP